jgi:hypothetical protein
MKFCVSNQVALSYAKTFLRLVAALICLRAMHHLTPKEALQFKAKNVNTE